MINLGYRVLDGFRVNLFQINNVILGIATDIGPRILYLAHKDNPDLNIFGIVPELTVETSEGLWRIFGGHRLWVSPEAMPRSYSLDDKPVEIMVKDNELIVRGNPETANMIQKEIIIRPGPSDNSVEVIHRITNIGRWDIEFACWALSVMKRNGFAIIPIKSRCIDEKCLLPDRVIALWPYTKLADYRVKFSNNFIFIKHDERVREPIKIGVRAYPYWAAYYVDNYVFIKRFYPEKTLCYPDFNVYVEVYANDKILELETLGPLRRIAPGESNEHREIWYLVRVGLLEPREDNIVSKVEPLISIT